MSTKSQTDPTTSPPAASSAEGVCGECGAANPANRDFCGGCGVPLWFDCLKCQQRVSSSTRFCGHCGVNLPELVETHYREAATCLEEANTLAAEFRFSEAVELLGRPQRTNHARLNPLLSQITARRKELAEMAARHRDSVESGLGRVRQMIAAHEYREAIEQLEKLPPALRDGNAVELLEAARSKQRDIDRLTREVKQAIARKEYLQIAPSLKRLITLAPQNQHFPRLADQIAQRVLKLAKQRLHARDFEGTLQLTHSVPGEPPPELEKLFEQAREVVWLKTYLRQAPYVDATLESAAARLAKVCPDDETAAKSLVALRAKAVQGKGEGAGIPWTRQPPRTTIGLPLEWRRGGQCWKLADPSCNTVLAQHPGIFFTAFGLALQGLGRGACPLNLVVEQKSVLGLSLGKGKRRPAGSSAWGIDIGSDSLKVIQLVGSAEREPVVNRCVQLAYGDSLSQPAKDVQRGQMVRAALQELLREHSIAKGDVVCINLPAGSVLHRVMSVPKAPAKKFVTLLQHEFASRIPVPIDDLVWEFQELPGESTGNLTRVLIIAARKSDVRERLEWFGEQGISVQVVQSGAVALHNYATYDWLTEAGGSAIATADVGAETTTLVVSSPQMCWFRSLQLGGKDFTSAIARDLQLTTKQAEQLKRQPSRARSLRSLDAALEPALQQLQQQLQRSLASFHQEEFDEEIRCLSVVGGGARVPGLFRFLAHGR